MTLHLLPSANPYLKFMSRTSKQDAAWEKLLSLRNERCLVKKYNIREREINPWHLNQFNGQNNSMYHNVPKYYAFYSRCQIEMEESIQWREFERKFKKWGEKTRDVIVACNNNYITSQEKVVEFRKARPYYDKNVFRFKDRWGRPVEVSDIYCINKVPLDEIIKTVREKWGDAEFRGVVVRFNNKGRIMK